MHMAHVMMHVSNDRQGGQEDLCIHVIYENFFPVQLIWEISTWDAEILDYFELRKIEHHQENHHVQ